MSTLSSMPELPHEVLDLAARLAVSGEVQQDVVPLAHQQSHGAHQQVHAVLLAHHAQVADEVAVSAAVEAAGAAGRELLQAGGAAHDEHVGGVLAAAGDRQAPVGIVGSDDDVGERVGGPLGPLHDAFRHAVDAHPASLRKQDLRTGVVLIEDEGDAPRPEEPADQEEEVGRIAGVDRIEGVFPPDSPSEAPGPRTACTGTLARTPQSDLAHRGRRIPVDPHAAALLVAAGVVPPALRTDHGHLIARRDERRAFVPDAAVERHRQVLDEHEDVMVFHAQASTRRASPAPPAPSAAAA